VPFLPSGLNSLLYSPFFNLFPLHVSNIDVIFEMLDCACD